MSVLFLPPSAGAASVPDASETVSGKIRIATSAEATAGTNDLTAMTPAKTKSVVDAAVVGGVTYQGTFDASAPADLSNATKGDLYIISVAGTYQGQTWAVGDHLLINADMGGTLDPAKIDKVDNTDSVTSVAGRTGAVTLSTADISGLATVASTGAYSDLTGAPTLATVATTGAYSDLSGTPTLGTAAAEDVGTAAGNVVQLDGSARLPAVDGSQLINLPSGASTLGALTDVDVTGAVNTNVLKYNSTSGDWEDGAVAYSEVTGTPTLATVATTGAYSDLTGTPTLATVATTGAYSDLTGTPTLATVATTGAYSDLSGTPTNVSTFTNDAGYLTAITGESVGDLSDVTLTTPSAGQSLVYNGTLSVFENATITATVSALNDIGDVSAAAPNNGDVIAYNSTSGDWEATAQSGGGGSAPSVTVSSPSADQTLTTPSGIEEVYIYTPSTAINVNLVAAATCGSGFKYQIKNRSTNTLTIDPNGAETIDGSATFALSDQEASVTLVTDGSSWFVI